MTAYNKTVFGSMLCKNSDIVIFINMFNDNKQIVELLNFDEIAYIFILLRAFVNNIGNLTRNSNYTNNVFVLATFLLVVQSDGCITSDPHV